MKTNATTVQGLTVGATCGTCDWAWKPEHRPTTRDIPTANKLAEEHRASHPGHITSVSAIDRKHTAKGSSFRMLSVEIKS